MSIMTQVIVMAPVWPTSSDQVQQVSAVCRPNVDKAQSTVDNRSAVAVDGWLRSDATGFLLNRRREREGEGGLGLFLFLCLCVDRDAPVE